LQLKFAASFNGFFRSSDIYLKCEFDFIAWKIDIQCAINTRRKSYYADSSPEAHVN